MRRHGVSAFLLLSAQVEWLSQLANEPKATAGGFLFPFLFGNSMQQQEEREEWGQFGQGILSRSKQMSNVEKAIPLHPHDLLLVLPATSSGLRFGLVVLRLSHPLSLSLSLSHPLSLSLSFSVSLCLSLSLVLSLSLSSSLSLSLSLSLSFFLSFSLSLFLSFSLSLFLSFSLSLFLSFSLSLSQQAVR
jgi:hypothetical protein